MMDGNRTKHNFWFVSLYISCLLSTCFSFLPTHWNVTLVALAIWARTTLLRFIRISGSPCETELPYPQEPFSSSEFYGRKQCLGHYTLCIFVRVFLGISYLTQIYRTGSYVLDNNLEISTFPYDSRSSI